MIRFGRLPVYTVAAALMAAPVLAAGSGGSLDQPGTSDSRILVRFAEGITTLETQEINRRLGVTVVGFALNGEVMIVEVPYADTRQMIIDAYTHTEGVLYAEADQLLSIPERPGDTERWVEPVDGTGDGQSDGTGNNTGGLISILPID